jgi:hypothetical protein
LICFVERETAAFWQPSNGAGSAMALNEALAEADRTD